MGFLIFLISEKNFLKILVFDDSLYYIDQNSFLASVKITQKYSLRVWFVNHWDMGSENQNWFFDFSEFRKNFLTILVFDDSVYYIDQNSFLATLKLTQKDSLTVYFVTQWDMGSENQNGFFDFSDFRKKFTDNSRFWWLTILYRPK